MVIVAPLLIIIVRALGNACRGSVCLPTALLPPAYLCLPSCTYFAILLCELFSAQSIRPNAKTNGIFLRTVPFQHTQLLTVYLANCLHVIWNFFVCWLIFSLPMSRTAKETKNEKKVCAKSKIWNTRHALQAIWNEEPRDQIRKPKAYHTNMPWLWLTDFRTSRSLVAYLLPGSGFCFCIFQIQVLPSHPFYPVCVCLCACVCHLAV